MEQAQREILAKTAMGKALNATEAEILLSLYPQSLLDLMHAASASLLAARLKGRAAPFTCSIINAKSGRCAEDCAFCAQSASHNTNAPVYALLPDDDILRRAETMAGYGAHYFGIVTSGAGPTARDFERLLVLAERISKRVDIKLCASLGILEPGQAESLKAAGFSSCHHNLETSASYYPRICSTHPYGQRLETVRRARAAGLRVCSGGIFGMGESWKERLELSSTLSDLDVDSIPVNFLNPIPGTPLEKAPGISAAEALAVLAILRLMHPERDILVCGGRGHSLGEWENSLFMAGANGLMIGDYLTTQGSPLNRDLERLRLLGVIKDSE